MTLLLLFRSSDGGAPATSTGGGKSSRQLLRRPSPRTRPAQLLEETYYKLNWIIIPRVETQFVNSITGVPYLQQTQQIIIRAKATINAKLKEQKIKLGAIFRPEYRLGFIGMICKNEKLQNRFLRAKRVLKTPFYMTLHAKADIGIDIIKQAILMMDDGKERFTFDEPKENWREALNAEVDVFNHASSFVGDVQYDTETHELFIDLNGKTYIFCNIPKRTYTMMKNASSKGEYFNRVLKGRYQCF